MARDKQTAKIEEAQDILKDLGLPPAQYNRICALTLLALAGIKPESKWHTAIRNSMTLSKDIMEFVNEHYNAGYAANTRESFRKSALKPFVENNIILHNPDNPDLSPNSALNHYALSNLALETITKYDTNKWEEAVQNFKKYQFPENQVNSILLKKISIQNYKSILNNDIELGRFNVFIGENGCGKSNILEALAAISAAKSNDLSFDGLYSRGVRIARPDLMLSSFLDKPQDNGIFVSLEFNLNNEIRECKSIISPENTNDIYTKWVDEDELTSNMEAGDFLFEELKGNNGFFSSQDIDSVLEKYQLFITSAKHRRDEYNDILSNYSIFDLNTKSLRGITPVDSRKTPLGLNGEGLDLLISSFNSYEKEYLKKCEELFSWLESIISDKEDKNKLQGLKPGRSSSTLYFTDRFMQKKNNTLSAENSNEGILHVLFYLALFISTKTPQLFAIDNIETALNPKLCQRLIKELALLAKERGKQVLITTHNPAVLDGLNLLDDEQRLFEVFRTSEGHTKTRRIKFKSDLKGKDFKLSEMWMKGALGAVPEFF